MNQFDTAPSCVQNAMMTKDKKPFTYTPGGIDLSQIKSPRMAKRIAMNAQNEGVTGQSRPSPLSRPNGTENSNHSPSSAMGAAAMGMPFQVFPTQPPPQPKTNKTNGNIPPPPPPSNLSTPAANNSRRSLTPQSFDPPPMGFRPEIKIPTNPMAALKKVPKPQEKNDFWVEEYKKERSKSPMVERNDSPQPPQSVANGSLVETVSGKESTGQNEYQPNNEAFHANHVTSSPVHKLSNGNSGNNEEKEDIEVVTGTSVLKNSDEVDQPVYKRSFETQSSPQHNIPQVFNNNVSTPVTPSPKVFQNQYQSPSESPVAHSPSNGVPSPSHTQAVQISSNKPASNGVPSPAQSPAMQPSQNPISNNVVPTHSPGFQAPKPVYSSVTPPSSSPTVQAQQPRPQLIYNNVSRDTMSPFNRGASPQPQLGSSEVKNSFQPSYQTQKNVSIFTIFTEYYAIFYICIKIVCLIFCPIYTLKVLKLA